MMLHKTSLLLFLRRFIRRVFLHSWIPKGEDKWHYQVHHITHMPFSFQSQSHGKPKSHCYMWSHKKEHNLEKQKSSVAGLIFFFFSFLLFLRWSLSMWPKLDLDFWSCCLSHPSTDSQRQASPQLLLFPLWTSRRPSWSFLRRMKRQNRQNPNTKDHPTVQSFLINDSFLLQEKNLILKKCGFIYIKMWICTQTAMVSLPYETNPDIIFAFCFYYTGDLFFPGNLSKGKSGFRCFFHLKS